MHLTSALERRIAGIEDYLDKHSTKVKEQQAHLKESTTESLYWHYGYMMALKDILRQLGVDEERH